MDLAVPSDGGMTILLGNGDGTFTTAPAISLPQINQAVAADFNGDGKTDLAISLPDANEVQVLLGNGDGTFTPKPAVSAGAVWQVAAADLNGDGKADLIVLSGNTLTIQLGNGDGTFTTMAPISLPVYFLASVVVGDLNGDGVPDLAVACDQLGEGTPGMVTILLGNGDGTFTPKAESPATGPNPSSITAGDFNGDGILDLAVANMNSGTGYPGSVTVLLGHGDGTFVPTAASPATGINTSYIAVGDFNGDGKVDLVSANAGSNTVTVFLANGDGTFGAPMNVRTGANPLWLTVQDFNGDGIPDLAVADGNSNSVAIMLAHLTP
jgi:FG-GAP-like repeat